MKPSHSKTAMQAFRLAEQNEKECTGCAQSALAAILDTLNITNNEVFKSASGLADGLGLSGNGTCGALIAGSMAIGYVFGRERVKFKDPMAAFKSYELVKKLHDQYLEKYGAVRCNDVQTSLMGRHFNLWDPKEAELALEKKMLDHCSGVTAFVAKKATLIILEEQDAEPAEQQPVKKVGCGG